MIKWGEEKRRKDPFYFCKLAMDQVKNKIVIISDCRRPTDFEYFKNNFDTILSVRIEASSKTREKRGFKFKHGVDDADSECALDHVEHDYIYENDDEDISDSLFKRIKDLSEAIN